MEYFSARRPPVSKPLFFLFVAVAVYGLLGSPTPDDPGMVEGLIGGLLVLSMGASVLKPASWLSSQQNGFLRALQIFFLCGLIFPTLTGAYFGNDLSLMLRDILAFLFLGLPLFLGERFKNNEMAGKVLCLLLIITGILFSIRTLLPVFNVWAAQDELLYLSNSPLALFAAIFLAGSLWVRLLNLTRSTIPLCVLMAAGLGILIAAMLLDVQRATIGAVLATIVILAATDVVRTPKKVVLPSLILAVAGICLYPVMSEILAAMARKTAQVGLNMRAQEAQAVFDALSASPLAVFMGLGWGSIVASPAVGGLDVNYTHSLLTTMALKGGVILLMVTMAVVLSALYQIVLIYQRDRVHALALFWPLIIPVLLYASHKSLDFGLLLLMIGVWSNEGVALHRGEASCKTKGHRKE